VRLKTVPAQSWMQLVIGCLALFSQMLDEHDKPVQQDKVGEEQGKQES